MNRSVAVLAVLACFAVAGLTACGSDDSGGSSTADSAAATSAKTTEAPVPAPASSETTPPATTSTEGTSDTATVVAKCHELFDPVIAQLRKIKQMVDGIPRFVTYRAATKKLAARYEALDVQSIPSKSCLNSVSIPIATAHLSFYGAGNFWLDCRKRGDCAKVMPKIKKQWRDARKLVDKGSDGFAKVTAN
jgi:hypothetical protein